MEQEVFCVLLLLLLSHFSRVRLCVTIWTAACQAPLSVGFSRQGYWSGLPCPLPGDLPNPGIEPRSPAFQADSLPLSQQGSPPDCSRKSEKAWLVKELQLEKMSGPITVREDSESIAES